MLLDFDKIVFCQHLFFIIRILIHTYTHWLSSVSLFNMCYFHLHAFLQGKDLYIYVHICSIVLCLLIVKKNFVMCHKVFGKLGCNVVAEHWYVVDDSLNRLKFLKESMHFVFLPVGLVKMNKEQELHIMKETIPGFSTTPYNI
jgi:hypothetical protein